jgi:hypothetical protein
MTVTGCALGGGVGVVGEDDEQADRTANVEHTNRVLTRVVSIEPSFSSGRRHLILRRRRGSYYSEMIRKGGSQSIK